MEVLIIRVSLLGLGGLDYSFGCGVLFVGFSWLLGGIYSVFFVVGGFFVYIGGRWNYGLIIRIEEIGWGVGFN